MTDMWEYEVQHWQIQQVSTRRLNLWGRERWELVKCIHHHSPYRTPDEVTVVFRRRKADGSEKLISMKMLNLLSQSTWGRTKLFKSLICGLALKTIRQFGFASLPLSRIFKTSIQTLRSQWLGRRRRSSRISDSQEIEGNGVNHECD